MKPHRFVENLRALRGGRDLLQEIDRVQTSAEVQAARVIQPLVDRHCGGGRLPPPVLRARVGVNASGLNFWAKGVSSSQKVLEVFGTEPDRPVLDWGCGSGRTLLWLREHPAWRDQYHGCDVDPDAIEWLESEGQPRVTVSPEHPPLAYDDGFFGGVFAFSILTHIEPARHRAWYGELARILAPDGRALITVDSVFFADEAASAAQRAAYERDGHAFREGRVKYQGASRVSEVFSREAMSGLLDLEVYEPRGYLSQDVIVARRAG